METYIQAGPEAVSRQFADWLQQHISPRKPFHWALSGGSTPKLLFQLLAGEYASQLPWADIHFWWGDERCVPPDDPDSNFGMTAERLLDHVPVPARNIHRVLGEAAPGQEAQRYANELLAHLPLHQQRPVFDLVMLGMGEDGHTASIFPDQMDLLTSDLICAVATHPASGQKRISLTGKVINEAKNVAFLVTGASKHPKIKAIFEETATAQTFPAAHIQPRGNLFWFLDQAAAQG